MGFQNTFAFMEMNRSSQLSNFATRKRKHIKKLKDMKINPFFIVTALSLAVLTPVHAQKDSTRVKDNSGSDRNVMLNAENSVGPREINIGLPATVGGTNIFQNGMPITYHFWPEMPTTIWRTDATFTKVGLMSIPETALESGTLGYSATSEDNRGTDKLKIKGSLSGNHFGKMQGTAAVSGPLGKGWKYVVGAYLDFDPGTFDAKGQTKYYADNAKLFKFGLTKDYRGTIGKGSVTFFYRFAHVKTLQNSYYAPYVYSEGGKVKEYNGFNIGTDNYIIGTRNFAMKDAFTGETKYVNPNDDYRAVSHSFDVLWNNTFRNGLKFDFTTRFRRSNVGIGSPVLTGIATANVKYSYLDGTVYKGEYVQNELWMNTRRTPIYTWITQAKIGRRSGNHTWSIGLQDMFYHIKKYCTESTSYSQSVEENPQIVVLTGGSGYVDGFHNFNSVMEYHRGNMNKLSLILKDTWNVSSQLDLKGGIRLEYQGLHGRYMPTSERKNGLTGSEAKISNDWLNKTFYLGGIYKITRQFGAQLDALYTETGGILGNYNTGTDPKLSQSKTPMVSGGLYLNNKYISVVSLLSYISKSNYRANSNFTNPETNLMARALVKYDVKTVGWTTDVVFKPINWFNLHFLLTLQNPKYGNYNGTLKFSDGTTRDFDFDGSVVTGISKVLMEIDPTFMYKGWNLQLHARYFGKQYANLSNTLTFEPHWETFARLGYKINKNFNAYVNVVNLLNDRGAKGSISGTDLMTADEAKSKYGTVMSGTYIRPFTVEFGVGFNF